MKLIKEVDLLNNQNLISKLNFASVPILAFFIFLFSLFINSGLNDLLQQAGIIPFTSSLFILTVIIMVHEVIHGAFFKLFKPNKKVKFGFKNGFAYATSPGSLYSKTKFIIIVLSPFVLITAGLVISTYFKVLSPFQFVIISSFHGTACVGDFYWTLLTIKAPKQSVVEDTDIGISFYLPDNI